MTKFCKIEALGENFNRNDKTYTHVKWHLRWKIENSWIFRIQELLTEEIMKFQK